MVKANDGERNTEQGSPAILSAGAAHDLANLVAVIGGTAAILADESRDDPSPLARAVREHAIRIGSCVEKASDLIERLPGRASKPSAPRPEIFDLGTAVEEALDLTQPLLARSLLTTAGLRASPFRVNGAPLDAIQLVLNLVLNARDAVSGSQHPHIAISCDTVVPPLRSQPLVGALTAGRSYARVRVADTGPGLDTIQLKARLAEPATQDDPFGLAKLGVPGLGSATGRGWGLRIVADIIRRADGALHVYSSSEGATFEAFWPLAAHSDTPNMTDRVVLLIAGDPVRTAASANAFEAAGAEVALCLDAEEALRSVSEDLGEWDLVLLAGRGRRHEPWNVAERMREADATVPLLLLAGDVTHDTRAPDGCTAVLPVDARPLDLLQAAERLMPLAMNGAKRCAF